MALILLRARREPTVVPIPTMRDTNPNVHWNSVALRRQVHPGSSVNHGFAWNVIGFVDTV